MKSILIKDTTKEEREKIIQESLGDEYEFENTGIDYQLYIDGKKELRELNEEARPGFEVAHPEKESSSGCSMGL